jgi:pyridinium-3,5-biscarboxylic acid mononucleotide synthase
MAAVPGSPATAELGFAAVDLDREHRQGLPEIVYAPGKQPHEITGIVAALLEGSRGPVLVTRVAADVAETVQRTHAGGTYDAPGRVLAWRVPPAGPVSITVVTAGTSDGPVADEAAAVARAVGLGVTEVRDVGVAGLHRLLGRVDELREAEVIVVVAGMEGALASVVAGLVGAPVVAVPTSTGYGAAFEGVTALLAMLSSCAAGVTVVNIDSGFGAALAAHRLAYQLNRAVPAS